MSSIFFHEWFLLSSIIFYSSHLHFSFRLNSIPNLEISNLTVAITSGFTVTRNGETEQSNWILSFQFDGKWGQPGLNCRYCQYLFYFDFDVSFLYFINRLFGYNYRGWDRRHGWYCWCFRVYLATPVVEVIVELVCLINGF